MPYQDKDPHRTGMGAKFPVGKIVYSAGITDLIARDPVAAMMLNTCVRFHESGQWSTQAPEDIRANEQSLDDGSEIVTAHQLQGRAILIVTDAEPRETTRVMLRAEYASGGGRRA